MEDVHRLTLGESLILFLALASFAAFFQLWIIAGVGRIRVLGWIVIIAATYVAQYLLILISGLLDLGQMIPFANYLVILIPFIALGIPWLVLPWKRFRSD